MMARFLGLPCFGCPCGFSLGVLLGFLRGLLFGLEPLDARLEQLQRLGCRSDPVGRPCNMVARDCQVSPGRINLDLGGSLVMALQILPCQNIRTPWPDGEISA